MKPTRREVGVAAGAGATGFILTFVFRAPESVQLACIELLKYIIKLLGPLAVFTVAVMIAAMNIAYWAVKRLDRRNEQEVERIAAERDRLQKMFIDDWQSTRGTKK